MAQTFEALQNYKSVTKEQLTTAVENAVSIIKGNLTDFTDHFQSPNTYHGFYEQTENVEWTTGFWTGEIWLAY